MLKPQFSFNAPPQTVAQRLIWYAQAELELARSHADTALEIIDQVMASAASGEHGEVILHVWHLRARALLALKRATEAETKLLEAQGVARTHGARPMLWRLCATLGKLYKTSGRREQAERKFAEAGTIIEDLATELTDETLRDTFLRCATGQMPRPLQLSPRRTAMQAFGGLLEQQIAAFNAQLATQAPPQVVDQISQYINTLIASGVEKNALKVGEKAPSFTLPDALGRQVSPAGFLQQGPVVVTFYHGEWCPYCNLQLHAYQQVLPQIKELGASLIAISPQTPDHSLAMNEKHALAFPVLSDQGNQVARQFGLVYSIEEQTRTLFKGLGSDLSAFNGDESWELPVPGTFIISQDGTIRLTYADANYTHRLEPSALLDGLRTMRK